MPSYSTVHRNRQTRCNENPRSSSSRRSFGRARHRPFFTSISLRAYDGTAPVAWWRLDGAGHPPPSLAVPVATTMAAGAQNRDVEFAELAWAFFAARLP